MNTWLNKIKNEISELIFPSNIYCIACGNLIDKTRIYSLCDDCRMSIKWINENSCIKCGRKIGENLSSRDDEVGENSKILLNKDKKTIKAEKNQTCYDCNKKTHAFVRGFSCVEYSGGGRDLVHNYKYKKRAYFGTKIAELMYDRIVFEPIIDDIDLILPVPMYKQKERERGFNQSDLIGKNLAKRLNIKYYNNILVRERKTEPMSGLGNEERIRNLENAFDIVEKNAGLINGMKILLIDDVYTTGSTVNSCSEILLQKGAFEIYVFTFASGANKY